MEQPSQNLIPFQQKLSLKILENANKIRLVRKNQSPTLAEKITALLFILQEQQICYANPVAEEITGYSRSQLSKSLDFYQQLNPKGLKANDLNHDYTREIKIISKTSQEYWLDCHFKKIELENKPAILITAFDVTKYKQEVDNIHQALIAEKQNSQNQERFASLVSHEFRTPLNVISFSTSLLKRHLSQWKKEKQLKYLDRLQKGVEQLTYLIDEVLTIGRAEADKLQFNPQLLDLSSFCDELVKEINLTHRDREDINYTNLLENEIVLVDKNLLKPILINLLDNAIKYSPVDSVVNFGILLENKQIVFKIKDRGIGIPLEEQTKIFEPFHRSNNVGEIRGHGLGLAMVKKLVDLHEGQVVVESELKKGSTFIATIPLKLP